MGINFGDMNTTAPAATTAAAPAPLLNLSKGETLCLDKVAKGNVLNKIFMSGGWDVGSTQDIDVDIVAVLTAGGGRVRNQNDIVYFAQKTVANGIVLGADNRNGQDSDKGVAGSNDKDDEIMQIELSKVDSDVEKIHFFIVIYDAQEKQQTFGMIKDAFARIVNMETAEELCRVPLSGSEYLSDTAVEVATLKRNGSSWDIEAAKQGLVGDVNSIYAKFL